MSDLIEREDAINRAIEGVDDWDGGCNPNREEYIRKAIESIPSADRPSIEVKADEVLTKIYDAVNGINEMVHEVNRPSGEWVDRSDGGRILHPWWESCECSQCKEQGSGAWNFCPHCGCRMKGADDEVC